MTCKEMQSFRAKLQQNLYYMQFSNIKARRQNQNIFHKVCLYIPIIRYTFSNLIIFIVQILIIFQLFCICIKGVIYNQRLEVRENNESLDTVFKDHVLRLIFVEILKGQKIDYFLKLDKYPSRHKDVAKTSQKRVIYGLKDVLDWSEMEVATAFF